MRPQRLTARVFGWAGTCVRQTSKKRDGGRGECAAASPETPKPSDPARRRPGLMGTGVVDLADATPKAFGPSGFPTWAREGEVVGGPAVDLADPVPGGDRGADGPPGWRVVRGSAARRRG